MEKLKFSQSEVLYFIEEKIQMNEADQNELNLYEDYLWFGKLKKMNYTYKHLIEQMRELYNVRF